MSNENTDAPTELPPGHKKPYVLTPKELGVNTAIKMINSALQQPTPQLLTAHMDTLYHCALHILAHRVFNIGMGARTKGPTGWDASRAFDAEKDIEENLKEGIDIFKEELAKGTLLFADELFPLKPKT